MTYRNDLSSLSFGARVRKLESENASSKRRIQELESNSPDDEQKRDLAETRKLKRQETARASALLASASASIDELQSIDQALLPKAQRFLVEQEIIAKGFAAAMPSKVQLDEAAWQRIRHWQSTFEPSAVFERNNAKPEPEASGQLAWGREFYRQQRDQRAQHSRLSNSPRSSPLEH
jgi:hypothetical protein